MRKVITVGAVIIGVALGLTGCASPPTLQGSLQCESLGYSWVLTNTSEESVVVDAVTFDTAPSSLSATWWTSEEIAPGRFLAASNVESFNGQTLTVETHPESAPLDISTVSRHLECDT